MEFVLSKDVPVEAYLDKRVLSPARATNPVVSKLLSKLKNTKVEELVDLVNSISNQGITVVDVEHMVYKWHDVEFDFTDLSTAECLFLIAKAADISKTHVYLQHEVLQLTMTTFRKFSSIFKNSKYITLVFDSELKLNFYKRIYGGLI